MRSPSGWVRIALLVGAGALTLLLAACVTALNLAARGVLALGGFVAVGGPYQIAHPAPEWALTVPASILLGAFAVIAHVPLARRLAGFDLLAPLWFALFSTLGLAFLQAAFGGGTIAWAWLLCGVLFIVMSLGAFGFVGMLVPSPVSERTGLAGRIAWGGPVYVAVHVAAAAAGVAAGFWLWGLFAA